MSGNPKVPVPACTAYYCSFAPTPPHTLSTTSGQTSRQDRMASPAAIYSAPATCRICGCSRLKASARQACKQACKTNSRPCDGGPRQWQKLKADAQQHGKDSTNAASPPRRKAAGSGRERSRRVRRHGPTGASRVGRATRRTDHMQALLNGPYSRQALRQGMQCPTG